MVESTDRIESIDTGDGDGTVVGVSCCGSFLESTSVPVFFGRVYDRRGIKLGTLRFWRVMGKFELFSSPPPGNGILGDNPEKERRGGRPL